MKNISSEYNVSIEICQPLVTEILKQNMSDPFQVWEAQYVARAEIRKQRRDQHSNDAEELSTTLSPFLLKSVTLAKEKGSSSWLTFEMLLMSATGKSS